MSVKYSDPEYANERIAGSVVRHNGYPVYVDYISEGGSANVHKIGGHRYYTVDYEELDLTPVPLGNVNMEGGVMFARRIPKRRDWRQGLRQNNLNSTGVDGYIDRLSSTSSKLVNTILGRFPSVQDCIESIECGETLGRAFGRFFSLGTKSEDGYVLYYRGKEVGHMSIGADKQVNPKLDEDYQYLREMLQEEMKIG